MHFLFLKKKNFSIKKKNIQSVASLIFFFFPKKLNKQYDVNQLEGNRNLINIFHFQRKEFLFLRKLMEKL